MIFVTGLPRSRTYWFSEYLSPYITSYHEAVNSCNTKEEFYAKMEAGHVSNSDSGLFMTDFQTRWPQARTLVIHRPVSEVRDSLRRIGIVGVDDLLEEACFALNQMNGLHINFTDVNSQLNIIHEYLLPWTPYDEEYAGYMKETNLQSNSINGNIRSFLAWR